MNTAVNGFVVAGTRETSPGQRILYWCLMWALGISYLLLPIERGFPRIVFAGFSFTLTIVITLVATFALILDSRGALLIGFRNRYVVDQSAVVLILLVSLGMSVDKSGGLFVLLNYVTTFVLNFLIIDYLFQRGMRKGFRQVLVTVVGLAALVGIAEGLFRMLIPFYWDWFRNYDPVLYAVTRSQSRVFGTLGNPLVFGLAVTLSLGWVGEVDRTRVRWFLVAVLATASVLTISTTVALLWLMFALMAFVFSRHKIVWGFIVLLAGLGALLVVGSLANDQFTELMLAWGAKTDLQTDGYQFRSFLINWTIEHFFSEGTFASYLFGWGLRSSNGAVYALGLGQMATLDNVYMALLYEGGLLGLGAYCIMAIRLLFRHRHSALSSLHWYVILGLLVAGFSYTTIFFATFNLVFVASLAALEDDFRTRKLQLRRSEI